MRLFVVFISCLMVYETNAQEAFKKRLAQTADSIRGDKSRQDSLENATFFAKMKDVQTTSEKEFPGIIPAGNMETLNEMRRLKKKYGLSNMKKASDGKAWIGMGDDLCYWGLSEPNSRKNNYSKSGVTQTWIYYGQANGCVGSGCPFLDYIITFKDHKAIAITTSE